MSLSSIQLTTIQLLVCFSFWCFVYYIYVTQFPAADILRKENMSGKVAVQSRKLGACLLGRPHWIIGRRLTSVGKERQFIEGQSSPQSNAPWVQQDELYLLVFLTAAVSASLAPVMQLCWRYSLPKVSTTVMSHVALCQFFQDSSVKPSWRSFSHSCVSYHLKMSYTHLVLKSF